MGARAMTRDDIIRLAQEALGKQTRRKKLELEPNEGTRSAYFDYEGSGSGKGRRCFEVFAGSM
jgi:hypothetical protein